MQRTGLDLDQADDVAVARSLVRTFGDHAQSAAREQAAKSVDHPIATARWSAIADAVAVLQQANAHLEIALGLLESVGETSAAPFLTQAIVALGIGDVDVDVAQGNPAHPPRRDDFYRQKAQQHLDQAKSTASGDVKALYLDLASCYITLLHRSETTAST